MRTKKTKLHRALHTAPRPIITSGSHTFIIHSQQFQPRVVKTNGSLTVI